MNVLGIESSGPIGCAAALRDEAVLAEESLERGMEQGRLLVPLVDRVIASAGWDKRRDIDLIAVSRGPGSFTGLRVGITCAKTLAALLDKPLAGVCSLDAMAENAPAEVEKVLAAVDAKRGQVYAAVYQRVQGTLHRTLDPAVLSPVEALNLAVRSPALPCMGGALLQGLSAPDHKYGNVSPATPGARAGGLRGPAWAPAGVTAQQGQSQGASGRSAEPATPCAAPEGRSPYGGAPGRTGDNTSPNLRPGALSLRAEGRSGPGRGTLPSDGSNESPGRATSRVEGAATVYVIGDAVRQYASDFAGPGCTLAPEKEWRIRASVIARIGLALFRAGQLAEPAQLEPSYLRLAEAEERRQLAAAQQVSQRSLPAKNTKESR